MLEIIGQSAGRYQILERIGRGGMSVIYKALDQEEDKTVAIKVLSAARAADSAFEARFAREIEVLQTLKHRRILPIMDYGDIGGLPFIVMPFFPHGTLQDRIEQGMSLKSAAKIIDQVADALAYAHNKGVTHRDVKPTNILLTKRDRAVLTDFGFAHLSGSSLSLTGSALIGTPAYMSPEQIRGKEINGASDQYSLAVVMYELVAGRTPFEADSPLVLVFKHLNDPVPDPREFNPDVPEEVVDVLLKALSKDPKHRYASVADLNNAFQEAVSLQSSARKPKQLGILGFPAKLMRGLRRIRRSISRLLRYPEIRRRARIGLVVSLSMIVPAAIVASAVFGVGGGFALYTPETIFATQNPTQFMAIVHAVQTESVREEGSGGEASSIQTAVAATVVGMMGSRSGESDGLDGPMGTSTPTATLSPTSTPQLWFYPTVTRRPPATATPIPSIHVSDIDASSKENKDNPEAWDAEVKIWIVGNDGLPIEHAIVTGTWSFEGSDIVEFSCETKRNGDCRVRNKEILGQESITFTITDVSFSSYIYDAAANEDPDDDSDGTTIEVSAP